MRSSMEGDSTKMTKDQLTTYVETVKARENVRAIMSQLKLYAPELYQAMVAERDEYMARGLDSLDKFGTTVAVMGIAHLDGVEGSLREKGWEPVSIPCPAK
uniref:TraB family protein n=1 Tax=Pseudictyota dubia TaxID=2749911 RepID=A0A7R9WH47_9STRA